ncbi:MAG TPA: SDR family NAD(P)-dependent oxidoreductase [Myxococcales bacterium]|nr:SDR family NAD(P)-dependent oxidoreductase [Myxococcales bacterium]
MRARKRFAGKVALVTGASAGLGEALARRFAQEGADVALLARREGRLAKLARELSEAHGVKALPLPCDVTADWEVTSAVRQAVQGLGRLDVVVANAGFGVGGPAFELTVDDYRRQMETNVFGVLRIVYATLPELAARGGSLAMVGSVNGHLALPGTAPYAMSKFAVRALAETLRYDLAPHGISVTHISPGFIDTEIRRVDNQGRLHPGRVDPVPAWLRMPPETAAAQIADAILRRRAEKVLTRLGALAVWLERNLPSLMAWAKRRMAGRTEWKSPEGALS